ncbi:nucleoside-diphosphate sugar epimerase [Gillisia sp. Hel1_33_143]|uniref:nucleoside-diphosphate sugar epimerase n=1 Tax=Gillisia sp. Hel1_33_143 TaxID=1336796 RepID=UPI000B837003|nr:nucleoside-diphosphate sugar epimerase [Gillisia sp. Hel1_33_143]
MKKTAIIIGATGLTGGILLKKLLKDPTYGTIKLFSRSSVENSDPKIEEHLIDMFELEKEQENFKADEVYVCIGTTKGKTPDKQTYRKIDKGIPVAAAKLSKLNNINTYLVISALGADANSSVFYNKVKGEMQEEVLAQKVPNTYIFQPSLISGDRDESRFWENVAKKAMSVLNVFMIGGLKKYRSIHPDQIADAMKWVANNGFDKQVLESDEIIEISNK